MKNALPAQPPVFVHASPRSGSTYFFNVLRRAPALMCFNEALMDRKGHGAEIDQTAGVANPAANKPTLWNVNHHFLDRRDDGELIAAWNAIKDVYPLAPAFSDYLPRNGVLAGDVTVYLSALRDYANSEGKRAVFCEINSRGRAGALRDAFGGFHAAQIRDPISQFGSFYRPFEEAGEMGFLVHPLKEIGINGDHPLYRIVPEAWRPPVLPWPAADPTRRWATTAEYFLLLTDRRPHTLEKIFRWHMFGWLLGNLAAIAYSDFVLDIDKAHGSPDYRKTIAEVFARETGAELDLSDITRFSRYYEFTSFGMAAVASQVVTAVNDALADGRLENALALLARSPQKTPTREAAMLLFAKIDDSLKSFAATPDHRLVTDESWARLATKYSMPWSLVKSRVLRESARVVYPFVAPVVRAVRKML